MNEVSGQTVQECFLRCGFAVTPKDECDDDDIPIAELVKLMKNAQKMTCCSEMTPEEFLKKIKISPHVKNLVRTRRHN